MVPAFATLYCHDRLVVTVQFRRSDSGPVDVVADGVRERRQQKMGVDTTTINAA